jgi:hypothetical protein
VRQRLGDALGLAVGRHAGRVGDVVHRDAGDELARRGKERRADDDALGGGGFAGAAGCWLGMFANGDTYR